MLPKVLISEETLRKRVEELSTKINNDYDGKPVTVICILKGGVVFFSDMIRKLKMPLICEFLGTSSYGNEKKSSGEIKLTMDVREPLEGKHVLVFEDIVDSGLTLSYILSLLQARKPASVKLCSLLLKPESIQAKDLNVDYVGFEIGDEFIVGYGLDYAGKYRGLPYIGLLEEVA
jgi:hypoxanthine phosphoribosyltransferase